MKLSTIPFQTMKTIEALAYQLQLHLNAAKEAEHWNIAEPLTGTIIESDELSVSYELVSHQVNVSIHNPSIGIDDCFDCNGQGLVVRMVFDSCNVENIYYDKKTIVTPDITLFGNNFESTDCGAKSEDHLLKLKANISIMEFIALVISVLDSFASNVNKHVSSLVEKGMCGKIAYEA